MVISRNLASGETVEAVDHNRLRSDVVDSVSGHDHDGTNSKVVQHANLKFENGYSPSNVHKDIDDHISANSGVHGKSADEFIAGIVGGDMVMIPFTHNFYPETGEYISPGQWVNNYEITLPVTMANTDYFIFMDTWTDHGSGVHALEWYVNSKTTTSFTIQVGVYSEGMYTVQSGKMNFAVLIIGVRA